MTAASISSQPTPVWVAGIVNLFESERARWGPDRHCRVLWSHCLVESACLSHLYRGNATYNFVAVFVGVSTMPLSTSLLPLYMC